MIQILSLVLLAILPLQFSAPLSPSVDIPIARLIAAAIITGFLVNALARSSLRLMEPVFTTALVSFFGLSLFSFIWAERLDLAIPKGVFFLNLFPLMFVWYDVACRQMNSFYHLIQATIIGALSAAILALLFFLAQFLFGVGPTFHFIVERVLPFFLGQEFSALVAAYPSLMVNLGGATVLRATAVFPDPHVAAYFFGLSGFLALGMFRMKQDVRYVWIAAIIFLADLLTFSRGGMMGLLVGIVVYAALLPQGRFTFRKNQLWPVVLTGVFIGIFLTPPIFNRFLSSFSFSDVSSTERIALWKEAVVAIGEHPVVGVGLGNYLASARPLYADGTPFYAHNLYLDIGTELGGAGLLLFFILFIRAGQQIFKARMSDPWVPAIAGALTLYLTHSLVETALFSLHVTILLVLLFVLAFSQKHRLV